MKEDLKHIFMHVQAPAFLVDNDAFAYTYNRPSAQSLFDAYAKPFGFSYKLDDICTFKI